MIVLEHYAKLQLVTILEWNLPIRSQKDVRTEAQFSALNDCNMRSYVNNFKYAAMVDFDEFIIPREHANLPDLLGTALIVILLCHSFSIYSAFPLHATLN